MLTAFQGGVCDFVEDGKRVKKIVKSSVNVGFEFFCRSPSQGSLSSA